MLDMDVADDVPATDETMEQPEPQQSMEEVVDEDTQPRGEGKVIFKKRA